VTYVYNLIIYLWLIYFLVMEEIDFVSVVEQAAENAAKKRRKQLIDKHIWDGKPKASERVIVQFVFDHMDVDVKPEDAPSAGAWGLLMAVRNDPTLKMDFYKTIWPRLLPSRSQIETGDKFTDDGRETLEIIGKVERAYLKATQG